MSRSFHLAAHACLLLFVLAVCPARAAEEVKLEFHFATLDQATGIPRPFREAGLPKPPLEIMELQFKVRGSQNIAELRLTGGDFDPLSPSSYTLTETVKGKAPREVPILAVAPVGVNARPGHASAVLLLPKQLAKEKGTAYKIALAHRLAFTLPGQGSVEVPPGTIALRTGELDEERKYTLPLSIENKLEILNGTGGGNASLHYHLRRDQFTTGDWLHLDFDAKADISLASREKHRFLDSMVAELDFFHGYNWSFGDETAAEQGHAEFGLTSRFESDRDFENMNITTGVAFQTYFKNRVTTGLHHLVAKNEAGVAPLFVLAYDYVGHISQSDDTPDTGNQRLRAGFYYSLPVFRELRVPVVDLFFGVADADFLIAAEALYDVEHGMLVDNTKLTLDIRQHTEKQDGWSYNLTYARGRATPTYKNFDALLFGVKKWF